MATTFIKGQEVKLKAVVPQGPVIALRMDEDGNVSYLVQWVDANNNTQQRWFAEEELIAA
jgi:uncharacterized protein YodC (DUF2158 family)